MNDASNESPTSEEGTRQIYCPRRLEVIRFNAGAGKIGITEFRVRMRIPDARLICKFTLLASALQTAPAFVVWVGRPATIWLYAVDEDQARSRWVPVNDIVGTSGTPVLLPATGLGGFSREFVTTADGVEARIQLGTVDPGGVQGSIFFQARFQAKDTINVLPWAQWDEMRRGCQIELLDGLQDIP